MRSFRTIAAGALEAALSTRREMRFTLLAQSASSLLLL